MKIRNIPHSCVPNINQKCSSLPHMNEMMLILPARHHKKNTETPRLKIHRTDADSVPKWKSVNPWGQQFLNNGDKINMCKSTHCHTHNEMFQNKLRCR